MSHSEKPLYCQRISQNVTLRKTITLPEDISKYIFRISDSTRNSKVTTSLHQRHIWNQLAFIQSQVRCKKVTYTFLIQSKTLKHEDEVVISLNGINSTKHMGNLYDMNRSISTRVTKKSWITYSHPMFQHFPTITSSAKYQAWTREQ
jgi:hypothetical protein